METKADTGLLCCSFVSSALVDLRLNIPPRAREVIPNVTIDALGILNNVPNVTGADTPINETPNHPLALITSAHF